MKICYNLSERNHPTKESSIFDCQFAATKTSSPHPSRISTPTLQLLDLLPNEQPGLSTEAASCRISPHSSLERFDQVNRLAQTELQYQYPILYKTL